MSIRTNQQNKSLHLLFEHIATELNDAGLYVGQVIRFDAPWDKNRVKELIWREIQKKMTGKQSTTSLTAKEVGEIYEVMERAFIQKGIKIEFPSLETLMEKLREKAE